MSETALGPTAVQAWFYRWRDSLPPWIVCALLALCALLIPELVLYYGMALPIGIVGGLVGLSVVMASPYVGLLIFLGLLYLRPEEYFPALEGARMSLLVSLTALFAWLVGALLRRDRFLFHLPVFRCLLGFFLVAAGSTTLSGSGSLNDEVLELLKLVILFVLIVHLINTKQRLNTTIGALVLFTAWLGARTIWQYQQGDALMDDGDARAQATGIFGDPNDLALAMTMALPLALGIAFSTGRGLVRFLHFLAAPIFVWTIFVTNSRGGMLALAAATFFFLGRRLGRVGNVLGAIAVLVLFSCGPSRLSQMSPDDDSSQGRVEAWQAGIEMLKTSPIWGVGKGEFLSYHWRTAHNSLVLCQAELGLVGTAFWLGLFYFAFRDSQHALRASPGAAHEALPDGEDPAVAIPRADSPAKRRRRLPAARSAPRPSLYLQASLVAFAVGGFFLSRTYTPPLYVYLSLSMAAVQVQIQEAGLSLPSTTQRDAGKIALLTLGSVLLVTILIQLWSR